MVACKKTLECHKLDASYCALCENKKKRGPYGGPPLNYQVIKRLSFRGRQMAPISLRPFDPIRVFFCYPPYHHPPDWLRLQLCFAWLKMAPRRQLALWNGPMLTPPLELRLACSMFWWREAIFSRGGVSASALFSL